MPNFLNLDYKFMEELVKMPSNSKIFESEFVRYLLQYKWENYS
jgi:hypothetical protein